ncbi:MAG: hypothetical protein LBR23_06050 [Spirochaetaceae bacterium]|jgi:hypothetical protein|nr:hypothetical protein [Spirochaetaceae bacterium]
MYIDEKDYEQYCFQLPQGSRFGRNKDRFVREQLQKLHPCFSETCCIDCRYVLDKGRLAARVVVMEKAVLARYRMDRKSRRLTVKNPLTRRDEGVFTRGNRLVVAPALLLLLLSPALFLDRQGNRLPEAAPPPEMLEKEEGGATIAAGIPALCEALAKHDGRILSLTYASAGGGERLSLALSGVYPEDIPGGDSPSRTVFSDVSFRENRPSFSLEISGGEAGKNERGNRGKNAGENQGPAQPAVPLIREAVLHARGILTYEKTEAEEIGCVIPRRYLEEFFAALERLRLESGRPVEYLGISENSPGDAAVSVRFAGRTLPQEREGDFSFAYLRGVTSLFWGAQKPETTAARIPQSPDSRFGSYKKIGVIRGGGNITAEFYRTGDGKIIRRDVVK